MADYNINAVTRRKVFTGSAGVGPYAFTFEILDDDDLAVYFNATKLTKTTDYSVTINANGTGSVTLVVNVGGNVPQTPIASDAVIVVGARDIERTTDFVTAGDLLASSLNEQLDSLTIFDQQIAEEEKRTLQAPVYDPAHVDEGGTLDMTLPAKAARAGKTLQFNASTGNPEAGPTIDEVANAQTSANNAATSATAAATSATAAASSATSAAASATSATTAKTAAETAETNAETAETNAETAETNAASSATASAASASTASGHATTATTKASEAATSATTATTKASEAATSATASATSATASATSATASASSATASASSATASANSAAAAAASLDSFDDRYLGSKTGFSGSGTGPSTDNDGNALVEGALFFSADANEMRVYDGSNWIAASSAGTASLILYEYTATSGQTTFSGSDDNSATLSYTSNNIQVVMNGVILDPSDFTATNGTSVVLASGATTGDLLNIYAFKSFTVSDTVSASAGGTFAGNVNVTGNLDVDGTTTLDGLTVDGDVTLNDGSPNLRLKDTDTNRFVDLLYGTRVSTIRNTMASGEDMDTVEPSMVFSFKDDGETRTAMTIDHDAATTIHSSGGATPTYSHTNNGEGLTFRYNDDSGARTADIVATANTPAGATTNLRFYTNANSTDAAAERLKITGDGTQYVNTGNETIVVWRGNPGAGAYGAKLTVSPSGASTRLDMSSAGTSSQRKMGFTNTNGMVGQIQTSGLSTIYATSSDARLKENVTYNWDATTRLKQLKPARFNFIADADKTVDGFLAHEAQTVVPEAVTGTHNEIDIWTQHEINSGDAPDGTSAGDNKLDDDGNTIPVMQSIDQSKLVPLLVKTIQELEARITALEAE